jgi:5-methyltetrahydropteroyltriglutamate--homocysteine methyltransferase
MPLPTGIYRADHVGSLLRPKDVLLARQKVQDGKITTAQLREIEDKHVATVVEGEIACGLRSITDGEYRRAWFHIDFLEQLDGVERRGEIASTNSNYKAVAPPKLVVVGKLGHPRAIQVDDFLFLESQIAKAGGKGTITTKVCIPSPTMVHFRGGRDTIDSTAYPDLDGFFNDLQRVYQEEISDLYEAGCRCLQMDDTNLAYLCDEGMRKEAGERHGDLNALLKRYISLINGAISKRPSDMTIAIHLCRGNYRSQWFAQGGYEPVAEALFKDLNVDAYFLEYDDARSGDFSPLRHLPEKKVVVLGLMASKTPALDDKTAILKRLHEAAAYCPRGLEQLCLSHQCGFSSTMEGNNLTEDEQWAKLRLEVAIAKEAWSDDISK